MQLVDTFVNKLCWEEQDAAKHDKIRDLKLSNEEWACVSHFLGLLSVRFPFFLVVYDV
jgi:hypothetical protein